MEAYIADWVRTPRGEGRPFQDNGTLQAIHPQTLLSIPLQELVSRTNLQPSDVEDVIAGVANQSGDQADNTARLAILAMGWPVDIPGTVINRYCGSGQQALNFAAAMIASGQHQAVIAAGVEMWSRYQHMAAALDGNNPELRQLHPTVPQGISGDLIATLEGFTREELDKFGVRSHQRACRAQDEGRFNGSMIEVKDLNGNVLLEHDEHVRRDTTLEGLAALKPSFANMGAAIPEGSSESYDEMCLRVYPHLDQVEHHHHAGNSSGMTDGSAAMLITSRQFAEKHGLKIRARIVCTSIAAAEPVVMLTGPTPASKKCLELAGMTTNDVDLIEINEAFASVPLKTMRDLDLDPEKVNVNGGAIALGHPVGATGVVLTGTLLDELERSGNGVGLVTVCTGAGMATATIIERLD